MFALRDILLFSLVGGVLAAIVLRFWSWSQQDYRYVISGVTTALGMAAWNLVLNHGHATGLDVDAPLIALSWQDVGSGVVAFLVTGLVLGLVVARREPAERVVGCAAIAGLVAMIFDIFVL